MQAFADSLDHLLAELERLDLHVRSRVAALRRTLADDPAFRGLYISERDIDALLARPAGRPRWPADETPAAALDALRARNAARRALSLQQGIALRLPRLQRTFGLNDIEIDMLLLALAVDLDLRYERLFGYLQDDVTRKRPGVGLLLDLLAPAPADRLSARACFDAEAPLRASRLLVLLDDPALPQQAPLLARAVKVDERVVAWLLGSDRIDERLAGRLRQVAVSAGAGRRAGGQEDLPHDRNTVLALRAVAERAAAGGALVVHLHGAAGAGKRDAAAAVARDIGAAAMLSVDLDGLVNDGSLDALAPLIDREARLQAVPLYCGGFDALLAPAQRGALAQWLRAAAGRTGLTILAGRRPFEPAGEWRSLPFVRVALTPLDTAQRAALWRAEMPELADAGVDAAALAGKFKFGPQQLRDAAATARRTLQAGGAAAPAPAPAPVPALVEQAVHEACRLHCSRQLGSVARKITQKYRWNDIVLPPDRLTLLRDICNHMKYRGQVHGDWGFGAKLAMGKGLAVLFAGPSGTGKTMAADIIAGELGLDLFKIDLASVISKYIGETEKNLGSLFDEAETSNAILFFDEADALFGKRTEVRDSHDRYANVEVGYLLQRLEEYEGVAILATNFRKNMDEAFVRRLQFTVEFPFPDRDDRRRIWQSVWPHEMPRDAAIDAGDLGRRFEMTGGNIRNVALASAFLAADAGGPVQLDHVMRATQREFQKMGKLIDDRAFVAAAH